MQGMDPQLMAQMAAMGGGLPGPLGSMFGGPKSKIAQAITLRGFLAQIPPLVAKFEQRDMTFVSEWKRFADTLLGFFAQDKSVKQDYMKYAVDSVKGAEKGKVDNAKYPLLGLKKMDNRRMAQSVAVLNFDKLHVALANKLADLEMKIDAARLMMEQVCNIAWVLGIAGKYWSPGKYVDFERAPALYSEMARRPEIAQGIKQVNAWVGQQDGIDIMQEVMGEWTVLGCPTSAYPANMKPNVG